MDELNYFVPAGFYLAQKGHRLAHDDNQQSTVLYVPKQRLEFLIVILPTSAIKHRYHSIHI